MSDRSNAMETDRRDVLKMATTGAAGALGVGVLASDDDAVARAAQRTWEFDRDLYTRDYNNHTNSVYGFGQGMTVKLLDTESTTLDDDPATRFRFEVTSTFTAKSGTKRSMFGSVDGSDMEGPENTFTTHEILVTEESNADDVALWSSSDPDLLGFTPSNAGDDSIDDSTVRDSVALALSLIPHPLTMAAGTGLAAGSIVESLQTGEDAPAPGSVHFTHDTSNADDDQQPETNFCRFNATVKEGSTARIRIRDAVHASFNYGGTSFGTETEFKLWGSYGFASKRSEESV